MPGLFRGWPANPRPPALLAWAVLWICLGGCTTPGAPAPLPAAASRIEPAVQAGSAAAETAGPTTHFRAAATAPSLASTPAARNPGPAGVLGLGTPWETPWFDLRGSEPGPTLLLESGIHGDEVAGVLALDATLGELELLSGRVVILPRMNAPAVRAERRFIGEDLNLVFPGDRDSDSYERRLAAAIFDWVGAVDADVVVTLHESRYLHDGTNPRTFGQTVVYGVQPPPPLLSRILALLNADLTDPRHRFFGNYFPIATSSTEQFVAAFNLEGYCVETWRGFPLVERVALQRRVIDAFLQALAFRFRWASGSPADSQVVPLP
jgi:hypothetical protein